MCRHGTLAEIDQNIRQAIQFHLDGLHEDGLPVPPAVTCCKYIELDLAS